MSDDNYMKEVLKKMNSDERIAFMQKEVAITEERERQEGTYNDYDDHMARVATIHSRQDIALVVLYLSDILKVAISLNSIINLLLFLIFVLVLLIGFFIYLFFA
tara:strand:+ start:301 stop:612 length:312 start_codon:yes stop_codon:yes gene_type:complete